MGGDEGEVVGSETTYDMGLLGTDSAICSRTYVPYHGTDGEENESESCTGF